MGTKTQRFVNIPDRQLVDLILANDCDAIKYLFFERCDTIFTHVINTIYQGYADVRKEELITGFYLYLQTDNWRRLRQYEFKSKLDTWMAIVAIRYFNKKKNIELTKKLELDPLISKEIEEIPGDYDLWDEISKIELYDAIDRIPKPRERFALLGMLAGKTTEMLSKELACSESAVYNLVKRAKQTILKKMKGKEG